MQIKTKISSEKLEELKNKYPALTKLILESLSLSNDEITKYFLLENLEVMDDIQIHRLYNLLENERLKLNEINNDFNKYFTKWLKQHIL